MLKWIAGGAATFLALRYLLRLNRVADTINSRTGIRVHKVGLSGIRLKARVLLQNPNPIELNMQYPFVNITYKGTSLGTSTVRNELIGIPGNGEQSFEIDIQSAGWFSLMQVLGGDLVKRIRSGEKVVLDIVAITSTVVNKIPYTREEAIKLNI
ncbi:MAG: hypothetical protein MI921_26270 [Cytophagales bacterium]|nr:hypothetical protein [Cytophagales bacterium]